MILDRLHMQNFRAFAGTHKLVLRPAGPGRTVVLISGDCQECRDSVMEALRLALYGKRAHRRNPGAYDDYLRRAIHPQTTAYEGAAVQVDFCTVSEGRPRRLEVRRSWRSVGRGVYEEFSVTLDGQDAPDIAASWQDYVEDLLPNALADLFFFDTNDLGDPAGQAGRRQTVREALEHLLGLHLVEQLGDDLVELEKRQVAQLGLPDEDVAPLRRALDEAVARSQAGRDEIARATKRLAQRERYLALLDERLQQADAHLYEEIAGQRAQLDQARARLADRRQALVRWMATSAPLLGVAPLLDELAAQHTTFAGGDTNAWEHALKQRDATIVEFLREHDVDATTLRELEDMLERRPPPLSAPATSPEAGMSGANTRERLDRLCRGELDEQRALGQELMAAIDRARQDVAASKACLEQIPWEHPLAGIIERGERARARVEDSRRELARLARRRALADAEVERLDTQVRSVVGDQLTDDDPAGVSMALALSSRLHLGLARFRELLIDERLDKIERLLLDHINCLVGDERRIEEVRIDRDTLDITLLDAAGTPFTASDFSANERQLVALAARWALARAFGRRMPVVIDNAFSEEGVGAEPRVRSRYFPRVSAQLVLLCSPALVERAFAEPLCRLVSHHYWMDSDPTTNCASVRRLPR